MKRDHMLCINCVEEFPIAERHGNYCHKCYLDMTVGVIWKDETGPAPKEERMEPVTKRDIEAARVGNLRALYREAYMAALGGVCADANIEKEVLAVNFAQGVATSPARTKARDTDRTRARAAGGEG